MADYISATPDRLAASKKETQDKLDLLNLEISRLDNEANGTGNGGSKRRFEDSAFVEQSKEIVEGVRDAVKEGGLPSILRTALNLGLMMVF